MLDYVIRNGLIIDGSGGPPRGGDVGVRDGMIVAVGEVDEPGQRTFDADGMAVSPGFVDPHTHYDAQLFWDPSATPSSLHGVTTVVGGNCGFTLAPLRSRDADYMRRLMARVEGMSLDALEQGLPWSWESFGQFLDALEGRIGVNAAFMVGHSAVRRFVMGSDANHRAATIGEIEAMVLLVDQSLAAGAIGFSTAQSSTHVDGDGQPVPSRLATIEEMLALATVVGRHEGTSLEAIVEGCISRFGEEDSELLIRMSLAAGRPLNWNLLNPDAADPDQSFHQLALSDRAQARGADIVALTMPIPATMTQSFLTTSSLRLLPDWGTFMAQPVAERIARLRDPNERRWLYERSQSPEAGTINALCGRFGSYLIGETHASENKQWEGRVVGDIAAEQGTDAFDTLVEIVLRDDLRTTLWPMPPDDDDSWRLRKAVWDHPGALLGGSDAGAHLDRMCGAVYTTRFLAEMIRGSQLMSMERAVHLLTERPARLFGLRQRGVLRPGYHADLVVFDPATVGPETPSFVHDLPGDAARLTAAARGISRVIVNGVDAVVDGVPTDATAGTLLRSGRDTTEPSW